MLLSKRCKLRIQIIFYYVVCEFFSFKPIIMHENRPVPENRRINSVTNVIHKITPFCRQALYSFHHKPTSFFFYSDIIDETMMSMTRLRCVIALKTFTWSTCDLDVNTVNILPINITITIISWVYTCYMRAGNSGKCNRKVGGICPFQYCASSIFISEWNTYRSFLRFLYHFL